MGIFTSNSGNVFGLDIGYETLKLCETRRSGNSVKIVGFSELSITERILEKDTIKNKAKVANMIKEAMRQAKPHQIRAKKIVSALPETFVFSKTIQMPKMSHKELKTAIPNEAAQYLPMSITDVYIDYQILVTHPEENLMDILMAAAPKKLVDDYVEMAKMAKLELVALETKPVAVGRALIPEKSNEGIAILHIGTEVTRISIWDKGDIRLITTVSTGKNKLLESMGLSSKNSKEIAKVKIDENSKQQLVIPLGSIIDEVAEAIRYHQNRGYKPSPIKLIELCGTGALIPGLDKLIEGEIKIKTEVSNSKFNLKEKLDPHYLTSFGLSLREV